MALYLGNTLIPNVSIGAPCSDDDLVRFAYHIKERVDENGKYHVPEDWDDPYADGGIEKEDNTIYFVIKVKDVMVPFYSFQFNVAYTAEIGNFVNGQFVSDSSVSKAANTAFQGVLTYDGHETKVIKLSSVSNVTSVTAPYYTYDGKTLASTLMPCVLRYGKIVKCTNLFTPSLFTECEDVVHGCTNWGQLYSNLPYLTKIRIQGCTAVTRPYFNSCVSLCDHDFEYLVTSTVTNMSDTFSYCYNLKHIDVSNWDTSNITTMSQCWGYCYNLLDLKGLSNLRFPNCTSFYAMFRLCYSLRGEMDCSQWNVLKLSGSNAGTAIFEGCSKITKVNISNWNMSAVTRLDNLFYNCYALKEIICDNCIPQTEGNGQTLSASNFVYGCYNLKSVGGLLSLLVNCTNLYCAFLNCHQLKTLDFSSAPFSGTTTGGNTLTNIFHACYNLESLNLSTLDLDNFSYNGALHEWYSGCRSLKNVLFPRNLAWNTSVANSPELTHDSLMSLLNSLTTPKGTTTGQKTITLGGINNTKLTAAERQIAIDKGWTIA